MAGAASGTQCTVTACDSLAAVGLSVKIESFYNAPEDILLAVLLAATELELGT